MKMTTAIRIATAMLSLFFVAPAFSQSFEEFKKEQSKMADRDGAIAERQEFEHFKRDLQAEFAAYKRIVAEEYASFRKKLLTKWDDAEVSSKKRWVEYASDYNDRMIVDFEQGYIQLDLIVSGADEAHIEKAIEKKLADLVVETQKTAYARDELSQNIEKRITEASVSVKTVPIEEKPVLTRVLTGTAQPTQTQVAEAVTDLKQQATVTEKKSIVTGRKVVSVKIPMPSDSIRKKAEEYGPGVRSFAEQRGLDAALVFAVIQTESAFNPMARSHVPAYGLMQIVPQSAGKDAADLLFNEPRLLAPSYLYSGRNNIEIGAAYLYILWNRYLKKINSPESRLYCAIAAYNTGAGNVARAFVGSTHIGKAAVVINRMTPEQVYRHLKEHLPYTETRDYLERVTERMQMYEAL